MSDKRVEYVNTRSVLGKQWSLIDPVLPLPHEDIDPLVGGIVNARGFDLDTFFHASFKNMPDPDRLVGMAEAVKAFCDAVETEKKIAVFGDYDVDGATSTSLVMRWLGAMGRDGIFYIPDRIKEGYGPNVPAMEFLKNEENVDFILFLDTGTTAHDSLNRAAELGMEIVIIDHHEQNSIDPTGILVNPKQRRDSGEFSYLCTVGLVFLFLVAVQREMRKRGFFTATRPEIDLRKWLGIVALGTVADLVPLIGLNRVYVTLGLPRMAEIPGLRALADANRSQRDSKPAEFTERNCGFVFGPCINAGGRIADTRTGTYLLSTDDEERAAEIARLLVENNTERQAMTQLAKDKALEIAINQFADDPAIVVHDKDWHPGIVGIVAGRLREATGKPAIVLGGQGDYLSGSARSHENFNIGAAIIAAAEKKILVKGGGHHMAAGASLTEDRLDEFRAFINEAARGTEPPPVDVDIVLPAGKLTVGFARSVERMAPFGMGNPEPKVVLYGGFITNIRTMADKHLKLTLTSEYGASEAVLWNGKGTPLGNALEASQGHFVDLMGIASVNVWNTKQLAQLKIFDAMIKDWNADTQDAA